MNDTVTMPRWVLWLVVGLAVFTGWYWLTYHAPTGTSEPGPYECEQVGPTWSC